MATIGIFFGSDTGNTENIAKIIQKKLGTKRAALYNITECDHKSFEPFNIVLLGIPTWYYGELQCDWDDFFIELSHVEFKGKIVGLFGCGDQEDYAEYFCDAMGILYNFIKDRGAIFIGHWPTKDYYFKSSIALVDNEHFVGLALDEDRQPELTNKRIDAWVEQICRELKHYEAISH
ncbi:flavodoxin FldA [Candidatus Ishikawella capsulata]|uniref:Flavodoxin n=1 Tax=Candidatus Ishikawaella capsulata Mpkobe TaxID=476281 RepID=C5WDD8_9ENTR|nr:flavodoxin FldA [Candidatus Ishikawaella capsulata]BAH83344.1 flavodoxin 1 [Candidatus Ishikawaella capsulata Mpkobe]